MIFGFNSQVKQQHVNGVAKTVTRHIALWGVSGGDCPNDILSNVSSHDHCLKESTMTYEYEYSIDLLNQNINLIRKFFVIFD